MNEFEKLDNFLKRYSEKSRHHQKLVNFVYPELKKIEKCNILEFGVSDQAMSTELFLKYCIKKNCNLYSIDNINYSKKFDDEKWKFILSRDDNFDYIKVQIPDIFGLILLDTIHEANHVEKIIYYYFDKLELNSCFFIDDINWIPYLKDAEKNRFYNEINNYETFQKLLEIYSFSNIFLFYLLYLTAGLMIIVLWFLFPTFSLIIFLVIACYHFGKEDTNFLINYDLKFHFVLYFLKGSLIVFAPLVFHFEETINLFKILLIENENFYSTIGYLEEKRIFYLSTFISVIVSFFYALNKFKIVNALIFFDMLSIVILNFLLTPLLAFTIYFCFLHSLRHSISLSLELDAENLNNGFKTFIKKAAPLTLMTVIIYVFGIYLLSTYYTFDESIIKAIFIGLASLTFPHILLEYLIEKNEQ